MKLSPQSNDIISKLLAGQPIAMDNLTVGPLDKPARGLLNVLVKHFDELSRAKGDDRASKLRSLYVAELACAADEASPPAKTTAPFVECSSAPDWKIEQLRCVSIRGIAPPGERASSRATGPSWPTRKRPISRAKPPAFENRFAY